jgi:hypothetical protein
MMFQLCRTLNLRPASRTRSIGARNARRAQHLNQTICQDRSEILVDRIYQVNPKFVHPSVSTMILKCLSKFARIKEPTNQTKADCKTAFQKKK